MYRWIDHTSELELHIEAATEPAVFEDAARALAELLERDEPTAARGDPVTREIVVEADDSAALLAAWIEELVFIAESDGVVPGRVHLEAVDERGVRARVEGRRTDPPHLVKAVTYHRLSMEPADGGWRATVVLDV